MAVVARKRKRWTSYYVVFTWHGEAVWEPAGRDKRAAEALDRKRTKEVEDGTYHPDAGKAAGFTIRQYFESWIKVRDVRSVKDEERWVRRHVLTRPRFADLLLADAKPSDFDDLTRELKTSSRSETDSRPLSQKSISNVLGVLSIMFNDAHRADHCSGSPVNLKRGTLNRDPQRAKEVYQAAEVVVLIRNQAIPEGIRVLLALCLLGGMREGEACGRRWRDLDVDVGPLWSLDVVDQYDGKPLKTGRPRVVPVHPELAEILETWARRGFELLTCRKPGPDDFIVPNVSARAKVPHHTRSSLYKAFLRACSVTHVRPRSFHSTRHTFITLARRGGAPKDRIQTITHNAKGDMVDRYTHLDWVPYCDAVLCLKLDPNAHQQMQHTPGNRGGGGGPGRLLAHAKVHELPAPSSSPPGSIPGASTPAQPNKALEKSGVNFGVKSAEGFDGPSARLFRAQAWAWFQRVAA